MFSNRSLGLASLVVLTIIWAYNWIVMKSAVSYMSALDFSALRATLAFFILLFMLKITGRSLKPPPFWPTMLIGFFQTMGMMGLAQVALVVGGAGKVTIMVYTMPFWIAILSVFILKETLRTLQIIALITAAIGLLLIIQPWNSHNTLLSSVIALTSGFLWGIGAVIAKKLYTRTTVDTLSLTTWQMGYGAVFLIVLSIIVDNHRVVNAPYLWFALFYTIIPATVIVWVLWMYILKTMNASIAGLSTLLIPIIAILLSWWLLDEQPNTYEFIGIFMILLGLIFINYHPKKLKL